MRLVGYSVDRLIGCLAGWAVALGLVVSGLALPAAVGSEDGDGIASGGGPGGGFFLRELTSGLLHPMEMSIAGDGRVFIAERTGKVRLWDEAKGGLVTVLALEVDYAGKPEGGKGLDKECGLMGIALDPEFEGNGWVYLYYAAPGGESRRHDHCLSRFTFDANAGALDADSEKVLLRVDASREGRIHEAGSLAFGPEGLLYLSVGDNQIKKEYLFSCKTSSDSSDLRGKILRIRPTPEGGYTIPEGNLFEPGTPKTRPEIFVMGLRNPFRINVDQKTGWLLWGENGPPDRYSAERAIEKSLIPLGYDEFNLAKRAGYYGYPMIIGQQEGYPDIDHETGEVVGHFDPSKPVNTHPENEGLRELPPAQPPMVWYSGLQEEFPELGLGGESAIGGPVYHWSEEYPQELCLPKAFDNCYFIGEYARSWVKAVRMDEEGGFEGIVDVLPRTLYGNVINLKLGPKGRLHVLYYTGTKGDQFKAGATPSGTLIRLENTGGEGLKTVLEVLGGDLTEGLPKKHPGVELMKNGDCLACHRADIGVVGPSFRAIAERYEPTPENYGLLGTKVKEGGLGVWGELMIMPPHPVLEEEDLRQMLDAIFELRKRKKK
jgi:cytochrome c